MFELTPGGVRARRVIIAAAAIGSTLTATACGKGDVAPKEPSSYCSIRLGLTFSGATGASAAVHAILKRDHGYGRDYAMYSMAGEPEPDVSPTAGDLFVAFMCQKQYVNLSITMMALTIMVGLVNYNRY